MTDLQAAARLLADHDTAWERFQTLARLGGWVEARQRGVEVDACDAIVDAALERVRDLLRDWASEPDEEAAEA